MTPDRRLRSVERDGNRLRAVLRNEFNDAEETRTVDQVVVEHGTLPAAELFHGLAPMARNEGTLDIEALIRGAGAGIGVEPGGRIHAVPGRRRGGEPKHTRRNLRFPSPVQGVLRTWRAGCRSRCRARYVRRGDACVAPASAYRDLTVRNSTGHRNPGRSDWSSAIRRGG